jgi:hypothetical protein
MEERKAALGSYLARNSVGMAVFTRRMIIYDADTISASLSINVEI